MILGQHNSHYKIGNIYVYMKFQIPPWSNQDWGIHVPILYGPTCNLTFWRPIKYLILKKKLVIGVMIKWKQNSKWNKSKIEPYCWRVGCPWEFLKVACWQLYYFFWDLIIYLFWIQCTLRSHLSQPHFWKSVRVTLTLPKWGLGSPSWLPKF